MDKAPAPTFWKDPEQLPVLGGILGMAVVLLAAWVRPAPPNPEVVAGSMGEVIAEAIARGLSMDSLMAAGNSPTRADEAARQVAAVLPSQVRFQLLRYDSEEGRVHEVFRVPRGGGSAGRTRMATSGERDRYDLRVTSSLVQGRYLRVLRPVANSPYWLRFDVPRALFAGHEGGATLRWLLVGLLALGTGVILGYASRHELHRRRILALLRDHSLEEIAGDPEMLARGEIGLEVHRILGEASSQQDELTSIFHSLQTTTDHLNESLERIYSVSHEQSGGASSQAAAIQQVSTTAEEMAATARQISDNAARVTALAEETAQACEQGHFSVRDAIRGMEEVRSQVEAIAKRMTVLGANSSKIGGVIAIIDEISKQTNLLALNAAIEAAGAGDAGKRFGIVAVEVKRLADKTSNATKMIKDLIHAIQDDTENTVRETELGTEAAMAGADLVKAVGEALERIGERVEQTTHSAREIRVSTGQQTHASSQMAGSLGQITDVSKRIEEGTHRTVGALVDLRELSRGIQGMVTEVELE